MQVMAKPPESYDLLYVVLVDDRRFERTEAYAEVVPMRHLYCVEFSKQIFKAVLSTGFGPVQSRVDPGQDYLADP